MAKSKSKKVTSKDIETIKDLQQKINTVLMNIGNASVVKNQLIESHVKLQSEWKAGTEKLEKKYGNVNISLEDGSISPLEAKEEVPAVTA